MPPVTRQLVSENPRVVRHVPYVHGREIEQTLVNGEWRDTGVRNPNAISIMPPKAPVHSGSTNDHSRLAPSASARWTVCTAAPKFEKENEDRLFLDAAAGVVNLIPYLKKLPKAELSEWEIAAVKLAPMLVDDPSLAKRLSEREKKAIWKSNSSTYAREGTRAHTFAANLLLATITSEQIPEDFIGPVMAYVNHCRSLVSAVENPLVLIEKEVPLFYSPEDTGTCDFALVTDEQVWIRDLKYGQGVLESSVDNTQLSIYALSFIEDLISDGLLDAGPDTLVNMKIVQPRHHEAESDEAWEITLKELRDFCADIMEAAERVKSGKGLLFVPSDKGCKWCPCKAFCEARIKAAASVFDGPDGPGIDVLSRFEDLTKEESKLPVEERLAKRFAAVGYETSDALEDSFLVAVLRARNALESVLADAYEYLDARVQAGEQIEGLKLVEGREGNRKWVDDSVGGTVDKWLQGYLKAEKRYDKTLISPAQAEKAMNLKGESETIQKRFAEKVTRSGPKKVLALDSDKRQAVMAAVEHFEDITEEADDWTIDEEI